MGNEIFCESMTINAIKNKIKVGINKDFLPSLEVLLKIIEACNITVEEFFYQDVSNYKEDKVILNKIKELPSDKREALLKLL